MALIEFIRQAPRRQLGWMMALAVVSGIANACLVAAVNEVTEIIAAGERATVVTWGGFVGAFLIYYFGNKLALLRANVIIEGLLKTLRIKVMDGVRRAELRDIDKLGRGQLYTLVGQETNHLSVTFPLIVDGMQQAILLVMSLIYLATLSWHALVALVLAAAMSVVGYLIIDREFRQTMRLVNGRQAAMLDAIGNIIHGGKELRLNQRKSDAVFAHYRKLSDQTEKLLILSGENWAALLLLGGVQTYVMLGVVGLVFPNVVDGFDGVIFQVIPVLLFCMGPLIRLVSQWPFVLRADVGLQSIMAIDRQLDGAASISPEEARAAAPEYADFQTLQFSGLTYSHRDSGGQPLFTAGPLDLTVQRGEMIFLVGGNGSGKSTSMRLMTGLYAPEKGRILVDGVPVVGRAIGGYRELFSTIFVDFHLFDRLYGTETVPASQVNRMIEEMGLGGKVTYENGRFSRLALSTGQRKRLALIAALLEDRPVYVFDEWSAEQDVHFRAHFYKHILPDLKARGKTVIAVTHDERYWSVADRVVKMDLGRVVWDRPGADIAAAE